MMFLVIGLKSPATVWCQKVVASLASKSDQAISELNVNTAGELLREIIRAPGSLVVVSSRPDLSLRQAILEAGRPFILCGSTPRHAILSQLGRGEVAPIDAARGVMADTAALSSLVEARSRFLVAPESAVAGSADYVKAIAAHLGLQCSDNDASRANAAGMAAIRDDLSASAAASPALSREDEVAIQGLVGELDEILATGRGERILATRQFFCLADTGKPPLGPIDATGRNRCLVFGPYVALPAGNWTARCVCGFSEELVGTPMSIDIVHFAGGAHELARTTFTVTSAGRLDVNVRFHNEDPAALIEVRLFCDRPVFDGMVSFGFVEFKRNPVESQPLGELELLSA